MDEPCTVVLCRGCCCGSHLHRLREQVQQHATVRVSDCLGPCEHANIAVVVPSRAARQAGARPVWLGWILDDPAIDAIAAWARAGGPGHATPPALLALHQFRPPRRTLRDPA